MVERTQKQDKKAESDARVVSEPPEEAPSVGDSVELPFNLSKIDPKTLARADALLEGTGFSIQKLADWANEQTVKTAFIIENMPTKETVKAGISEALTDMTKQAAKNQKQAMHDAIDRGEMPRGGDQGGGQMGIGQLLGLLGGGGEDDEMKALQREMFKVNIEGMKAGIHMSNAITGAIVNKITGKAIGDVVEGIVK